MWRGVLAVVGGYAVAYVVAASVGFLAVTAVSMLGGVTPEIPQYLGAMLGGRALGGFLGGFTAAHLAPANPLRCAAIFAILLLVGPTVSFFRSDGQAPDWFFAALAILPAACGVAGGFLRWSVGRRSVDVTASTTAPGGQPAVSRVVQLLLGAAFLLASSIVTVGLGHGGMVLGLAPFLSPIAALVAVALTATMIAAAWMLGTPMFAAFCTLLLVPVIAGLVMIWSSEGFQSLSLLSATPLLGVWAGIVARAVLSRRAP